MYYSIVHYNLYCSILYYCVISVGVYYCVHTVGVYYCVISVVVYYWVITVGVVAPCGLKEEEAALCLRHYKEYLTVQINSNKLETLSLMEEVRKYP